MELRRFRKSGHTIKDNLYGLRPKCDLIYETSLTFQVEGLLPVTCDMPSSGEHHCVVLSVRGHPRHEGERERGREEGNLPILSSRILG